MDGTSRKISGALYYFRSSCFPLFAASQSVLTCCVCIKIAFFCKLNDKQNTRSNNSAHLKQVDISKKIINEVQQVLRHTYGHFWHSKVRILLMTGSVSDVEQLAPKLTRELWREDRGLCCCGVAILRLRPMQTGWLRCVNCAAVRWTEWSG